MKNEREHLNNGIKTTIISALLASGLSGSNSPPKETNPPNSNESYSAEYSSKLILQSPYELQTPIPTNLPETSPKPLPSIPTPEPTVDYQAQSQVVYDMEQRPDLFNRRMLLDVEIYYPIYEAVGKKFNLDWYVLWIIHERESTASQSKRAYNGGSYPYYGAMQRDVLVWTQTYVDKASKGLEYLADYYQRHSDDWKEIAFAGKFLYDHMYKLIKQGYNKDTALEIALGFYNNPASGMSRFEYYEYLRKNVFK